jgi:hypothetical protein
VAQRRINENPTVTDTLLFDLDMPGADGCFTTQAYKVDSVRIFYVCRDTANGSLRSLPGVATDATLEKAIAAAKTAACADPSADNLYELAKLTEQLMLKSPDDEMHFSEAKVVRVIGTPEYPAWLSQEAWDASGLLGTYNPLDYEVVAGKDEGGNEMPGRFTLEWNPVGMREGDYVVCWTWTPLPAGSKLSAYTRFNLAGNTQVTTSIPSHFTKPGKYETLQERFTPEMFKFRMAQGDMSPEVVQEFNNAVAKGFTTLENLANQIVDLQDANATHEALLPLLANFFGLSLRSQDPTMWRRQIKRAIPLFKKKGTLRGLVEAMAQAGIRLDKFTRMWQVISPYTYQEAFEVGEGQETFQLKKVAILPQTNTNFQLWWRAFETEEWVALAKEYVALANPVPGQGTVMTWAGNTRPIPIPLAVGDWVRVVYQTVAVPSGQQSVENYIRSLPVADTRDERIVKHPLKNWNVRLVSEDDPMIDVVIPERHPFQYPIMWGKVRTEFPYSENIYNMEEYNGSKRESTDPCDIDADFLDPCSGGASGQYSVDLEIENLSDDRLSEAREILREFTPFHAVLHSIHLFGAVNEFVEPPVEEITQLVRVSLEEMTAVDSAQQIFNRTMESTAEFRRDALASPTSVASGTGTARNKRILFYMPNYESVGVDTNSSLTRLDVLAPSANFGTYQIGPESKQYAQLLSTPPLPLDHSAFTFNLSNELVRHTSAGITQEETTVITQAGADFQALGVRSAFDVANDPSYTGTPWTVRIGGVHYQIASLLPDNSLLLATNPPGGSVNPLGYEIWTPANVAVYTSSTGVLTKKIVGNLALGSGTIVIHGTSGPAGSVANIANAVQPGDQVVLGGSEYPIVGFVPGSPRNVYIGNYTAGNASGVSVVIYRRLVAGGTGLFAYEGLEIVTPTNHETGLGITNGQNPPVAQPEGRLKEDFLVVLGSEYYAISNINGTLITLNGPKRDWTLAGTSLAYSIVRFDRLGVTVPERARTPEPGFHIKVTNAAGQQVDAEIPGRTFPPEPGHSFTSLDRSGGDVIEIAQQTAPAVMARAMNAAKNNEVVETAGQEESISFTIERKEGGQ